MFYQFKVLFVSFISFYDLCLKCDIINFYVLLSDLENLVGSDVYFTKTICFPEFAYFYYLMFGDVRDSF